MPNPRAKRTTNHDSHTFVTKREEFNGSNLYGQTYQQGTAPHLSVNATWMDQFETDMYARFRDRVTYIVWSFYTPIAYYVEGSGWYKVALTFSSFTARHRNGALSGISGHGVAMYGKRGDWTIECLRPGCWPEPRHFTREADASRVLWLHR